MPIYNDRVFSLRREKSTVKDKKLTILTPINVRNADGELETRYKIKYRNIWCYVRQYNGDEVAKSGSDQIYMPEFMFIINYKDDITNEDVILYKKEKYNIDVIDTFEGNKSDLIIIANKMVV